MTLIAAYQWQEKLLMIADGLTSDQRPSETLPAFPFALDRLKNAPRDTLYYPSRLRQKMHLLSSDVCIAYSGNLGRAEFILEQIKRQNIPPHDVEHFIQEEMLIYPKSKQRSVSFILVLLKDVRSDGRVLIRLHSLNPDIRENTQQGRLLACGSGAPLFVDVVNYYEASHQRQYDPNIHQEQIEATSFCYGILSGLIGREFNFGHDFQHNFGEFFEVVTPIANSMTGKPELCKQDKIAYLFWKTELVGKKIKWRIHKHIGYSFYHQGDFVIAAEYIDQQGQANFFTHIVQGAFSRVDKPNIDEIAETIRQAEPSLFVHFVALKDKGVVYPSAVLDSRGKVTKIRFGQPLGEDMISVNLQPLMQQIRLL